ncbi:hypothetical protein [uncultured Rhodospira sp.]|uniref:hypothetical protein n=1 Tax=uncultured Rhodospira sp. TaxID=1936189 RepID=UPI00260741DC|nr:hypothetical protein [uncultured Rhodospira sp.]
MATVPPLRSPLGVALLVAAVLVLASGTARADEPPPPADQARPDIMGTVSVRAPDLSAFPHWRTALDAFDAWLERATACLEAACDDLSLIETVWLNRVEGLALLPPEHMARRAAQFLDDLLGVEATDDVAPPAGSWPTLRDILVGGQRDARALALARYYTLRAAGLAPSALRLAMARDTLTLDTLYVILIETAAGPIAMTRYGVHPLTHGDEPAFVPLYAVDHAGRWLYFPDAVTPTTAPAGPMDRPSLLRREGLPE